MDGRTEREEFAQLTTSLTSMLTNLRRVVLVRRLVSQWRASLPPAAPSAAEAQAAQILQAELEKLWKSVRES